MYSKPTGLTGGRAMLVLIRRIACVMHPLPAYHASDWNCIKVATITSITFRRWDFYPVCPSSEQNALLLSDYSPEYTESENKQVGYL
jgi:hypothetical protein